MPISTLLSIDSIKYATVSVLSFSKNAYNSVLRVPLESCFFFNETAVCFHISFLLLKC